MQPFGVCHWKKTILDLGLGWDWGLGIGRSNLFTIWCLILIWAAEAISAFNVTFVVCLKISETSSYFTSITNNPDCKTELNISAKKKRQFWWFWIFGYFIVPIMFGHPHAHDLSIHFVTFIYRYRLHFLKEHKQEIEHRKELARLPLEELSEVKQFEPLAYCWGLIMRVMMAVFILVETAEWIWKHPKMKNQVFCISILYITEAI